MQNALKMKQASVQFDQYSQASVCTHNVRVYIHSLECFMWLHLSTAVYTV